MGRREDRPRHIVKRLLAEGWIERKGKGDHRNFVKTHAIVTIDMGRREIPLGTLWSIYRTACWRW